MAEPRAPPPTPRAAEALLRPVGWGQQPLAAPMTAKLPPCTRGLRRRPSDSIDMPCWSMSPTARRCCARAWILEAARRRGRQHLVNLGTHMPRSVFHGAAAASALPAPGGKVMQGARQLPTTRAPPPRNGLLASCVKTWECRLFTVGLKREGQDESAPLVVCSPCRPQGLRRAGAPCRRDALRFGRRWVGVFSSGRGGAPPLSGARAAGVRRGT
jgi:hypothetical protein